MIYWYGKEVQGRNLARHVLAERQEYPIRTKFQLARIVRGVGEGSYLFFEGVDPAKRVLQGMRGAAGAPSASPRPAPVDRWADGQCGTGPATTRVDHERRTHCTAPRCPLCLQRRCFLSSCSLQFGCVVVVASLRGGSHCNCQQ